MDIRETWSTIKKRFLWFLGAAGTLLGTIYIFATDSNNTRFFAIILLITSLYIIPKIYDFLNLRIKPLFVLVFFLIGALGLGTRLNKEKKVENEVVIFYVTANKLNVRSGTGKDYPVITQLKKGEVINIVEYVDNWVKITTSAGEGFISKEFISNKSKSPKETGYEWLGYLIFGGFIIYCFVNGKNTSAGNSSTSTSRAQKPKHICMYCGRENENLRSLTFNTCPKSPSNRCVPYDKGIQPVYYCKHCGHENKNFRSFLVASCSKSPSGVHQPL